MKRAPGLLAALGLASAAAAATWTGAGTDDNWTTAANWGGTAPAAGAALTFAGSARTAPVNDFAAGTAFGGVTFAADAAPFTLSGQALSLSGTTDNSSATAQTFALPTTFTKDAVLDAKAGDLVFAAPFALDVATSEGRVYKCGPHDLVFIGAHAFANANPRVVLQNGGLRFAPGSSFRWTGPSSGNRFSLDVQPNAPDRRLHFVVEEGAEVWFPNITVFSSAHGNLSGSTFDMVVDGRLSLYNGDTDFGDQAGSNITLTVGRSGDFYANWFSMGTRTPQTTTVDGGRFTVDSAAFGRHIGTGDRPGRNTFLLNAGQVVVSNYFGTMSTFSPTVENRMVFGNGVRDGATFESVPFTRAGTTRTGQVLLAFDGAEIVTRRATGNGVDFFGGTEAKEVLAGGFIFRADYQTDVVGALTHGAALPDGVRDGGITKRGPESLTLRDRPTVNGPVRVEEGRLALYTAPPADMCALYMAPGTMFNLKNNGDATDVLTAPEMSVGSATGASVQLWFNVAKEGEVCLADCLRIPSGGFVGRVNFQLCETGDAPVSAAGDYVLIEYADTYPQLSDLSASGLATGFEGRFVHDSANRRIVLRVTGTERPTAATASWAKPTGGTYGDNANWTPAEPVSANGSKATFGAAATEDATVTLETEKYLSQLVFDNATHAYTLAGARLELGAFGEIDVVSGSHEVAAPLELAGNANVVRSPGATLTLSGALAFGGTLRNSGTGTTRMTGSGSDGAVLLTDGTLVFSGADYRFRSTASNGREALEMRPATTSPMTLEIRDGSKLALTGLLVGSASGAAGNCHLVVADASVDADGEVTVGNRSSGSVRVDLVDGAFFTSRGGNMNFGVNGTAAMNVSNATFIARQLTHGGYALNLPGSNPRGGTSTIDVWDGGLLEVTEAYDWISDNAGQPHTLTVHAGGRLALPPTTRIAGSTGTATVALDGGVLACHPGGARGSLDDLMQGVDVFALAAGGGVVDTAGYDVTARCGLVQTAEVAGPFTKAGAGRLTLGGAFALAAPVVVAEGELVAAGCTSGALTVAPGAAFLGANGAAETVRIASLTLGDCSVLGFDAGDVLEVSGALTLAGAPVFRLRGVPSAGTRDLVRAAEVAGDVSAWRIVCEDASSLTACRLVREGTTVKLVVEDLATDAAHWTRDGDGLWQDAANWSTPAAPAGATACAVVDAAFTAARTLTLPAGGVALDALVVAAPAETVLAGGPLAANLLQVGGAGATLAAPLAPGAEPTSVWIAGGSALALDANVSAGELAVAGSGTLAVAATNAAATTVSDGATLLLAGDGRQDGGVKLNGGVLAGSGAHGVVAGGVTLAFGAQIEARAEATLKLAGGVAGDVPLRKTGAGTAVVAGGFAGKALVSDGLLEMSGLPAKGVGLSRGGFHTTSAGTLASLSGISGIGGASLFWNDADVAVTGAVAFTKTALVKRGAGTLVLRGAETRFAGVVYNAAGSDSNGKIAFGPHAEQPADGGIHPLVVAEGTVVLDNPDAVHNISVSVGRWTTDAPGAETEGHLVIRNGSFTGYLAIGRGNGSAVTAPTPLASSVRIEGGSHQLSGISMGHGAGLAGYRAAPLLEVTGGDVVVAGNYPLNIGEVRGSECTFRQTGGSVRLQGGNVVVGNYSPGGNATFDLRGGALRIANDLVLGSDAASTGRVHLATGATLSARMLRVGAGVGEIAFDGGTLAVEVGPLTNLDAVVESGGAVLEIPTARVTSRMRLRRGATGAGGFVKRGPGDLALDLRASDACPVDDYAGPVRLEEGSVTVRAEGRAPFPETAAFTGLAGTRLVLSEPDTFRHVVRFGSLDLAGAVAFRPGDRLEVAGEVVLREGAQVELLEETSSEALMVPGTYVLFTYSGAAPDVSKLSVSNPREGYGYAFAAVDGRVTVTLSAGEGQASVTVWNVDADGDWSAGANWMGGMAPSGAVEARFLSAATAARTVTVAGDVSAGGLVFANGNAYTLAGPGALTLNPGASGEVRLESASGTHRVEVPVTLNAPVVSAGAGTLVLAGGVTGDRQISKTGAGRLTLGGASAVPVDLRAGVLDVSDGVAAGQVAVTGGRISADTAAGKVTGPVKLMAPMTVSTAKALELAGEVSGGEPLTLGDGTLRLSHANTYTAGTELKGGRLELADGATTGSGALAISGGTLASAGTVESEVTGPVELTTNPTFDTAGPLRLSGDLATTDRRVFTKTGAGTLTIAGTWINPPAVAGQFRHQDGTLRLAENAVFELSVGPNESPDEFSLRVQYSTDYTPPPYRSIVLEKGSRLSSGGWFFSSPNNYSPETSGWSLFDIVVNGGLMESTGAAYGFIFGDQHAMKIHIDMHGGEIRSRPDVWSDIGTRTPVRWDVDGGAEVHLGWTAFGRQSGTGSGRVGGGVAIHVKDGLFDAGQYLSWQSTDDAKMTNVVTVGCGTRATNAVFQTVPTARPGNAGWAELVFDGGMLRATGTATNAPGKGSLNNYLSGANAVRVGPGGAGIDCAEDIAVRQAFEAGATGDGGVYKIGAGKATLEGSFASVTGRVDVLAGTLCALFPNTNDLFVASDATMDLSRGSAASGWTFARVSGSGAVAGGTLTVTTELSPGDGAGGAGTFHAEGLVLEKGVRIPFDAAEGASDALAVTGELALAGGVIDFGHDEGDTVALPYSGVLGTYGTVRGGTGGWSAAGLGYPATRRLSANLRADGGVLRFTVRDSGLALVFR